MQRRDAYPIDSVKHACFITGDYDVSEGIVDLDLALDVLPMFGRLCVSPKAVAMMMSVLGWELPPENVAEANRRLQEENRQLRASNARLTNALEGALEARKVLDEVST